MADETRSGGCRLCNPFNPYQPAESPLFADRSEEQERFRRELLPSLAPDSFGVYNAAILGPRGIGKTSLVRQLRYLAETATAYPVGTAMISCTSGFGDLTGFAVSLINVVENEALHLAGWEHKLRDELARWTFTVHVPGASATRNLRTEKNLGVNAAELLRTVLLGLWERVFAPRGYALLIVLDDVQFLQVLDEQALMLLRAVFQDLHTYHVRFALVVTGPSDLFVSVRNTAEPATRFFKHFPLGPFSVDDLKSAVRDPLAVAHVPLEVGDAAIEWL